MEGPTRTDIWMSQCRAGGGPQQQQLSLARAWAGDMDEPEWDWRVPSGPFWVLESLCLRQHLRVQITDSPWSPHQRARCWWSRQGSLDCPGLGFCLLSSFLLATAPTQLQGLLLVSSATLSSPS